jgi:hypothetical protein
VLDTVSNNLKRTQKLFVPWQHRVRAGLCCSPANNWQL